MSDNTKPPLDGMIEEMPGFVGKVFEQLDQDFPIQELIEDRQNYVATLDPNNDSDEGLCLGLMTLFAMHTKMVREVELILLETQGASPAAMASNLAILSEITKESANLEHQCRVSNLASEQFSDASQFIEALLPSTKLTTPKGGVN